MQGDIHYTNKDRQQQLNALIIALEAVIPRMRATNEYSQDAVTFEFANRAMELIEKGFIQADLNDLARSIINPIYPHPKAEGKLPGFLDTNGRWILPEWFSDFKEAIDQIMDKAQILGFKEYY